jgi:plasmid stabilization system protein ParE
VDLKWTSKSQDDLARLYAFLAKANPRIGERLDEFGPREVRRVFVGRYELRYEIQTKTIVVLRIWHARENR